jgi:hypothetical protein
VQVARYLVRRTFPGGLAIATNVAGAEACLRVVEENARLGVTWLQSYVYDDLETVVDVCDGPEPAAILAAGDRTGLPVDSIHRVAVLDPYFYTGTKSRTANVVPAGGQP